MQQVLQRAFVPGPDNPKAYQPLIRRGRVININEAVPTVDIAMMDGSGIYVNVPISSEAVSTLGGKAYLPSPIKSNPSDNLPTGYGKRDLFAIVAFLDGNGTMPVVLGFIRPNFHQLSFRGAGFENQMMDRHDSDRYHRVWGDAENGVPCQEELYWPDGSYLKISAESTTLTDLSGQNEDAAKTPFEVKNDDPVKTFYFKHASGTVIEVQANGTIVFQVANGPTFTLSAGGTVTSSTDIVAGTVSQQNHLHDAVQAGSDDSGPPVGGGGGSVSSVTSNQKSWMGVV